MGIVLTTSLTSGTSISISWPSIGTIWRHLRHHSDRHQHGIAMSLAQHHLRLLQSRRAHPHRLDEASIPSRSARPPCTDWICQHYPTYTCSTCFDFEMKWIRAFHHALRHGTTSTSTTTRTIVSDSARSTTSATSACSLCLIKFKTPSDNHHSHQASRSTSISIKEPTISSWLLRPTPSASKTRATLSTRP